jgi:hypothetical protein
MEDAREPAATHASLGLGVPSFGMALSSVALGSALSLRSIDGSISNAPHASVTSLHPPQACSNLALGHSSVVSFQGLLSPPLTPPRKELFVAEVNSSRVSSDLVLDLEEDTRMEPRPALGHDYELLEELFYAVYTRRGIHLQPTTVLPALVQSTGAFSTVETHEFVSIHVPHDLTQINTACQTTVPMPQHSNAQPDASHSPPTPDTSPNLGAGSAHAHVNRNDLTLQHALQGAYLWLIFSIYGILTWWRSIVALT